MTSPLPVADRAEVRRAAIRELGAERRSVVGLVLVNVVAAAIGLVVPWLLGRIIDTIQERPDDALRAVDRLALGALLFTIAQIALRWWALRIGYRFGTRTAARVRERFLKRALALPPQTADHLPTGDLVARGSTDVTLVASTLRSAVPEILVAVVHALLLIVAVLVLDPRLGLCGLVCLIGLVTAVRWYLRRARPAYLAVAATGAGLADLIASTAKGARTIELLGLEHRRAQEAARLIDRARIARLRALRLRTVLFPWAEVSLMLPVVGVVLVGWALYSNALVSLGTVVAATVYLRQLIGPLDTVLLWIEQLQGAAASYARVEGLANLPETEPALPPQTPKIDQGRGDRVRVDNASFSYTGTHDVLREITLTVQPGERLAVVGTSGAGKSTLARLLAGLDRPHTGSVTIGEAAIADLPPDQLREHIVLITQDHHVFHDTVRDNLLIARPHASDDDLRAALVTVGATWLDNLPNGLDTELGGEVTLDDARAQQLSLARVVLADPHTLILDEATSLLDPATARRTEQSLAAVLHGRTVIAIAHRLQTAHDADRIAVMEAGELVELGTHDELVDAAGVYGELWQTWSAGSRQGNGSDMGPPWAS